MKRIALLIASLLTLLPSWGSDDHRRRNITMNDGLMANTVRNIVQDKYGFIWFGTDNGLCRYDGVRVEPYRLADLGISQYVSALLADDDGLYVGTAKGVFFLRFDTQDFLKLPMDIHSTVTHLSKDKEGNLWVATMEQGVIRWAQGKAKHYDFKESGGAVAHVLVDRDNQVWTVTNWGRPVVQRLNRLHHRFEPVSLSYGGDYNALCMLQTRDGKMWLGTWECGLLLMHSNGQLEQVLSPSLSGKVTHIHTLMERADGSICIGCDEGVVCFNPQTREVSSDISDSRFVYAVMADAEGGFWIGTFYGGVDYISPVGKRFEAFTNESGLTGNVISHFCEDHEGRVWIASDDGGLMCYSPQERRFADYPHRSTLAQQNVHALCLHGEELWIGTYTNGVMRLDLAKGTLQTFTHTDSLRSLDNSSSYAICNDSKGRIWVATMEGLNRYDRENQNFRRIRSLGAMTIDMDEDAQGRLWLSTQGEGIWCYHPDKDTWRQYRHSAKDERSLADDQVNCTCVDDQGLLWVGTFGGLCRYDSGKDCFVRIPLNVPNQNVMSIIEDHGALWLTTERGIVKYVPDEGVQRFTLQDGLVSEQFLPNSGMKASDGRIYFGSTSGFNSFYPYQIKANGVMPPVYVTMLEVLNQRRETEAGLPLDMSHQEVLNLGYDEAKMLTLAFASLSYCSPEKNQYAYQLEGFDGDWNYVGNQNRATYTNLPAGTYTFRVKATNNDGVWSTNEATLRIVVHPPFWWSWYAKLFYLLLIVGCIWYYIRLRLRRAEREHQREMERLNAEKEKEVREARLNFFTMIAHEIRTPVSLIIGPLEKINEELKMKDGGTSALRPSLSIIDRNARRLLELVNQLLDFRKVEQQDLVIHPSQQNICEIVKSVAERFAPTFEQGGKRFTVDYPDRQLTAVVDREAFTKVISNLLSNANKYTRDEVRLSCQSDGEHFSIVVADNGAGIREEDRQRIFEPFFQAQDNKPGTGIGLNIVKNIVDRHHGTIRVASELGKGSVFTVTLPTGYAESQERCDSDLDSAAIHSDKQTMLIVDDSEDMVAFLTDSFKDKYEVLTAGDGIEGLGQLSRHEVSIIISDWMMPKMDGAEFCRQVRQNPQTSHIPFVMLTAKTDDDSKVQGMNVGADAYIEKPFSLEYLEACIRNMLKLRRQLMVKFSTQPLEPVTEIACSATDNEFLMRMNRVIEENFSNPDLNVNFLAERLNISRSGLFAKIKTLADVTPNEMIQIVRLKRAAQLLNEGGHLVNEVGYMVGFSSPSYFSKCFQKQFGITPGDYMKTSKQ